MTLAFGPLVTWNVIQLASPALSAWTAFMLCRHLTGRDGPSLVAGYVFGFSPYMLIHLTGGPYLALVALLPVCVWLVLRRVDGNIGSRAFVVWMGLALTGQYLISSEVLATATLFGAVALALAYALLARTAPGTAGHRPGADRRLRGHGRPRSARSWPSSSSATSTRRAPSAFRPTSPPTCCPPR